MDNIIATDKNIHQLISSEISNLGRKADLNHIDVSHVSNMTKLFSNSTFNGNISKWNTSKVEDMSLIFWKSEFNGDISDWSLNSVRKANLMFALSAFNNDISNVTHMDECFAYSNFNGDISKWDVSSVISMSRIFTESTFNQDISDWKFNPDLHIDSDLQMIIEQSHLSKIKKESALLKKSLSDLIKKSPITL
jgi:surface protein